MHRARDEHLGAIAEEKVKVKSEIQCNKNTDCITVVQLKGFRSRELRKVKSSITGGCCGDVHLCSLKQEKFAKLCNHHHYHHHINIAIMMIIIIITIIINITMMMIIIIITITIVIITRHGLAGSWGQDTDEVSTFLVYLTSHFAPAALSSDLTNLGPLITMKIHLETLKTMETN